MTTLRRVLNSRYSLWLLLAVPALLDLLGYWRGALVYGEIVHSSGETGSRLLIVTMAATPLALMFPRARLPRWLLRHRRHFGVAAFAYVLLHTLVYLQRKADVTTIVDEALDPGMAAGWVAFVLLLVLAVTSNDSSVRLLKRTWKRLHRWVYAAALLAFLHWVLVAFDPTGALIHAGVLVLLEGYRIWKTSFAASRSRIEDPVR